MRGCGDEEKRPLCPAVVRTYVVIVEEVDRFEDLPNAATAERVELVVLEAVRVLFQVLEYGVVDVLEDQVEFPLPSERVQQVDDVVAFQLLLFSRERERERERGGGVIEGWRWIMMMTVMTKTKRDMTTPLDSTRLHDDTFNIRTSRMAVFRICMSSSLSLNFLMATTAPVSL